jgi:hypothetical protein
MKVQSRQQLAYMLLGGAILIIGLAVVLNRNGFAFRQNEPFDWPGLVFTFVSLAVGASIFELLRRSQRLLRHNYVWYGLLWLIPVIFFTNASGQQLREGDVASQIASPNIYCSPSVLPRICHQATPSHVIGSDGSEAVIPAGATFQAGYLVMFVLYGSAAYAIYHSLKKRIKGYRHDDLFQ